MWDRSLLQPLFDFDWVWEVFTPEHKRRWGYYVLPILFRDRLVGGSSRGSTAPTPMWVGSGSGGRKGSAPVVPGVRRRDALGAYVSFAGADRLEWASHLDKEKRLFRGRP